MAKFDEYKNRYEHVRFERQDGILEIAIHRKGGSALWEGFEGGIHDQLGEAFYMAGRDRENKVVIITGTGDAFCETMDMGDGSQVGGMTPRFWDRITREGKDLLVNLMEIDCPVIGAVNGNAFIHAELLTLSDIVIAAEGAKFADKAHSPGGVPPTDGVHVVWPMLLGPNRARHFLLMGAEIDAAEAQRIGFVAEVVPKDKVRARAWEIARELAKKPTLMLRNSRIALTHHIKRRLQDDLGYGLTLEGMAVMPPYEG
jgi:enoyl-CoA hydratase/carnithine racemase